MTQNLLEQTLHKPWGLGDLSVGLNFLAAWKQKFRVKLWGFIENNFIFLSVYLLSIFEYLEYLLSIF